MLDFEKMFDDYVDQNQKVWDHDRSKTVGASEIFGCIRQAWFKKFGEELDYTKDEGHKENWGAMKRGDIMEDHWVVPVLEDQVPKQVKNAMLHLAGADGQVTYVYGKNSATPDGLITGLPKDALSKYGIADIRSDCIMVEIKSIDPRVSLTEEKAIHEGQVQTQMGILREMTEFKPEYAVIIYVDASFYDTIKVFPIEFDPATFASARIRAKQVFAAEGPEELLAEGKIDGSCEYCPFKDVCSEATQSMVPTESRPDVFSEVELDELYELVREEKRLSGDIKDLEHDKEMVRARIKQRMANADTKFAKDERFKVSFSWQKGRTSFDRKAAEEDGMDLTPYDKEGNGFEKLTLTLT